MATNISVLTGNSFGNGLVGLQFATDGGTPLFTIGNFQIDANLSGKQTKTFNVGEASEYYSLESLGETTPQDNELKINKTKLKLNPDYTNPKTYSYFGSIKEYFRVNVENIIKFWPASIYVNNVINTTTGNTIQGYSHNPVNNTSNFYVNNNFFVNNFDIKYVVQINNTIGEENPLRNLNVEYARYTIFYGDVEYSIINFTGSTSFTNDLVYFEVEGNPFPLATGGTLSTTYHIKPNSVEVENFFASLSDLSRQLLNRYIVPGYTIKFNYLSESDQGAYNIFVNRVYTWPVTDGYNLDIVSNLFDTYLTSLYEFCEYFDENDTNIMNRRLVAEAINRLNTIRRADGSEDENEAEKMSKLINIYAREFDEVKKYIDGLSYIRDVTYNKLENTPDTILKSNANTLGWKLLAPMSDVDLISSFIPTKSVYSGYTINYSTYDAEIEFWRRLIVNTSHLWRSKGSRKAIEFLFEFIGAPEQLVNFNEHVYMAKKPLNVEIFKLILNEITGTDNITTYNIDEDGFPKILPNTPYTYYQSNGLWYRQTAGQNAGIDILDGNNPHIGPYDGGKDYLDQFRCLIGQFSATTIAIGEDYVTFGNLFKNYSNGLINDYNGQIYLDSFSLDGKPNICFSVTGTVTTDPNPQDVLGLCGCPIGLSDKALLISFDSKSTLKPCTNRSVGTVVVVTPVEVTGRSVSINSGVIGILPSESVLARGLVSTSISCDYTPQKIISNPPIVVFSSSTQSNVQLVPIECCTTTNTNQSDVDWVDNGNGLGYCLWNNYCGEIRLAGFTSQGYGIFYNHVNHQSGTTAASLGVSNIDDCCNTFGGTSITSGVRFDPQNYCVFNVRNDTVGVSSTTANTECQLIILEDINEETILFNDGTVHFTNGTTVVGATLECCNHYSTPELPLTFCGGKCYWIDPTTTCDEYNDLKVTLGVDGNDGVYLLTGSSETCYFQVEFDMLVNFNCTEFLTCTKDLNILEVLSGFTIDATIETATGTTPTTLQTYPAFNFNINNKPTGVYFNGNDSDCNALNNEILLELGENCDIVTSETFSANWVKVSFNINNTIIGQKIKLGFNFNNIPCNFDLLVDNIKIDRLCVITNEDILNLTNCPGFDLDRVVDNKKSWVYTEERVNRSLNYLDFRETSYYENHSRLLINSKEIDLTLDAAKAIDNDVLCYVVKNDCFFTGNTGTTISDPYLSQYQSEIDKIDDVNEFRDYVLSRLVDPKSRQVIRSYPLLRYMFDKYLNLCGNNTCYDLGNQYNYDSLNNFIKLIGDYWIELVEQLVPSTSIWRGATRYYRNTVFDQPKYKYKNYSLLTCDPVCTQLISGSSYCLMTLTEALLYGLQTPVNQLSSPNFYLSEITDCWSNFFNSSAGIIATDINPIPPQILSLINSSGNSLNYASVTINGSISGNTIFSGILSSGSTIGSLTGVTTGDITNIIISSFSGSGYTITTDTNGIYITSPNDDDCGKTLDINYCLDLSLSGVSGTTSALNYPNIVTTPITIGTMLSDIARSTSNNSLYVLNDVTNGSVTVVDCATETISTTINLPGGQNPQRIVYNSTNNTMYVLAYSVSMTGLVFVIDCTTNTVITSIPLTFNPNFCDIVYTSVNNRVYVSDAIGNKIIAINCNTNTIISIFPPTQIAGFSYPGKMAYNPTNNRVYCTTFTGAIFMVDCSTNTIIQTPIPVLADNITYDSVNNRMYLTKNSNGTGRFIDCNTNIASTSTVIGPQAYAIEYCSPYNVIFVTFINSGDLKIFSAGSLMVNTTFQALQHLVGVSGNVNRIVYNPVNNKLYLPSRESGNIVVLTAPTVSSVVSTTCQTCVPLLSSTFQTIFSGATTLVCGTNECGYTGFKDSGVEVIVEPIEINIGTGSTSISCVEVNNQTICSKVFITDINDDVTFGGRILTITQ